MGRELSRARRAESIVVRSLHSLLVNRQAQSSPSSSHLGLLLHRQSAGGQKPAKAQPVALSVLEGGALVPQGVVEDINATLREGVGLEARVFMKVAALSAKNDLIGYSHLGDLQRRLELPQGLEVKVVLIRRQGPYLTANHASRDAARGRS